MNIFYDCQIIDRGRDIPLRLVSVGMVRDSDDQGLYLINADSLSDVVRDPWASMNILPHLPVQMDSPQIFQWDKDHGDYPFVVSPDYLANLALTFIRETPGPVALWSHDSAFDHVTLTHLFGTRAERPAGVPSRTNDILQLAHDHPDAQLPPAPDMHHSLANAQWVREAYRVLRPQGSE